MENQILTPETVEISFLTRIRQHDFEESLFVKNYIVTYSQFNKYRGSQCLLCVRFFCFALSWPPLALKLSSAAFSCNV